MRVTGNTPSGSTGRLALGFQLEQISRFDGLSEEWNRLAELSENVFASWEWVSTWWRHFEQGDLVVRAWRSPNGRLVALIPLYRSSLGPLRVLRFLGHDMSSKLGPICAPDEREEAARGLAICLREVPHDVLLAEMMAADEGWAALLQGTVRSRVPSPVLPLHDITSWSAYLASRSSNFRQMLQRKERKLAREHSLVFRLATERSRLDADLDTFFALHANRWGAESSLLSEPRRVDFHREFATLAFDRGWLRLWFLELDGEPVAGLYGLRFQNTESYYQSGRSKDLRAASLGLVLIAQTIREALADGINEYRLGPGGGRYKYRFTDVDPGLETLTVPNTVAGKLAVLGGSAVSRVGPLKQALKRALRF
jgi:CelD/BcsL family acetyltransferase involved in cellulose biosynthesis